MAHHVLDHLRHISWLLLVLAIATTACARFAAEPPAAPSTTTPPTESPTAPPAGDQPGDFIRLATEALARALDTDAGAIALVALERQDFPDAALGCPQPGEAAAAVLTPGYKIVLSINGTAYELHTNLDGTLVRCLPTGTPVVGMPEFTPSVAPAPTPDDGIDRTVVDTVAAALRTKDYDGLKAVMPNEFWLGFYASEADQVTRDEALEKLSDIYLGPGLVRIYQDVSVEKLLPEWTSAAPYARFVYSTGWGESQRDDAVLLFEEQADTLSWAGLLYVFEGLKKSAYGDQAAQLPAPPGQSLGAIARALEDKAYETIRSQVTAPVLLGFYGSEASQLSPEAFVETLERDYLGPGEVTVRFDVDAARLVPDWNVSPPCEDMLYSTGWGEDQADDGLLCLRAESGTLRWSALLYVFGNLKDTAYAEPVPATDKEPQELEGMVFIPEGPFIIGSSEGDIASVQAQCQEADAGCNTGQFLDETPQRRVTLRAFYIDKTEVSVAQFEAFVDATGYQTTSEAKGDPVEYTWHAFDAPERQDHPVRWMSWHDANAYCLWAGKRLPSEAEWEKAARGTEGLLYPWGNAWDGARVPHGDTAAVTAFPQGASPYDVLGMAGNVWEWVSDWYDPLYYQYGPPTDPKGPDQTRDKVLRGGAFANVNWKQRMAHRHFGGAAGYAHDHGFRCAKDE
jgi:formylglycine-generating enzyme required for sulfatase activity